MYQKLCEIFPVPVTILQIFSWQMYLLKVGIPASPVV